MARWESEDRQGQERPWDTRGFTAILAAQAFLQRCPSSVASLSPWKDANRTKWASVTSLPWTRGGSGSAGIGSGRRRGERRGRMAGVDRFVYPAHFRARIVHTPAAAIGCKPAWRRRPRVPCRRVCPHTVGLGIPPVALPAGLSLRLATKARKSSGLEFAPPKHPLQQSGRIPQSSFTPSGEI